MCSTNLGFSVEKVVLVLVWGTYYVPHTYVPGTSERFVANCGVGPSTRGQGDSASLVKPTQDQRHIYVDGTGRYVYFFTAQENVNQEHSRRQGST